MVKRINAHNLHEYLPDHSMDNVIREKLINTLNIVVEGLEETFLILQHFSIDVSHELRFPLAIIRGELETVVCKKISNKDLSASISRCLEEISYVTEVVKALLFLEQGKTNPFITRIQTV